MWVIVVASRWNKRWFAEQDTQDTQIRTMLGGRPLNRKRIGVLTRTKMNAIARGGGTKAGLIVPLRRRTSARQAGSRGFTISMLSEAKPTTVPALLLPTPETCACQQHNRACAHEAHDGKRYSYHRHEPHNLHHQHHVPPPLNDHDCTIRRTNRRDRTHQL
jgi:hypothetical protein